MNVALKVIHVDHLPPRPAGPFVVDFGDQTAVGLSGGEVEAVLESERNAHVKVYRIHHAYPDGRMELVGVERSRFGLEDSFLFWRSDSDAARADFESLRTLAEQSPPPCRARVQLGTVPGAKPSHVVAMLYPAEYADDMSAWLLKHRYAGGDRVEGGTSQATGFAASSDVVILERLQLWGTQDGTLTEQRRAADAGHAVAS